MSVYSLAVPHVSWQGHLGGFLGGVAVAAIVVYSPRQRRTLWQSVGMSAVTLVMLAAILAVTAALS